MYAFSQMSRDSRSTREERLIECRYEPLPMPREERPSLGFKELREERLAANKPKTSNGLDFEPNKEEVSITFCCFVDKYGFYISFPEK